jgi:predicted DNA-binding protein
MRENMKHYSVRLLPSTMKRIDKLARKTHSFRGEALRDLIAAALDGRSETPGVRLHNPQRR